MVRPVWDLPLSPAGILVELDNGITVRIRPIRPSDRPALLAAYERFSEESRYFRFFSPKPVLSDTMATALTTFDHTRQLAWAVFDPARPSEVGDDSGLVVASARLFIDASDPTVAEATLAVVDEYQRRGIGRFLMELLVSTAAQHDIATIHFDVLHENVAMRALLEKVGASGRSRPEDRTIMAYDLPVPTLDEADITAGALYDLLRATAAARATAAGDEDRVP